jgi:hypothetical protein
MLPHIGFPLHVEINVILLPHYAQTILTISHLIQNNRASFLL